MLSKIIGGKTKRIPKKKQIVKRTRVTKSSTKTRKCKIRV